MIAGVSVAFFPSEAPLGDCVVFDAKITEKIATLHIIITITTLLIFMISNF
jgi:hypothetical protein